MSEWIDELAETFALEPLSEHETDRLLRVARDVAHRVERKGTPLAAFLMGMDVASRVAGGASRDAAVDGSIAAVEALLPVTTDPQARP
jgi:hypothetical protein